MQTNQEYLLKMQTLEPHPVFTSDLLGAAQESQ